MEYFLYFATAFGLGAAHALEPGHGKTLVAAYLTGTQGKVRDAFLMGVLVTVFHTLSVFALGLLGVLLANIFFHYKEDFIRYLEVISGLIILGIGLMLFWRRFIKDKNADECECHIQHVHHPDHVGEQKNNSSLKEVISLGIASGISPCPMAIAAMMASIAIGGFSKLPEALLYLIIFSLGLSSVLVVIGLVLVLSSGKLSSIFIQKNSKLPIFVSQISTMLIIGMGVYLTLRPFFGPVELEGLDMKKASTVQTVVPESQK